MTDTQVAIVGGGLSGLNAARLMWAAGADFQLFEARDRLGGRILTVDDTGAPSDDGFDLGPSWIWPRVQPALAALVRELGLPTFGQSSVGDVVFERMSREPPQRYTGSAQEPQSMRLVGGTAALVRAVAQVLPAGRVHLGSAVIGLSLRQDRVRLTLRDTNGGVQTVDAEHVIVALPPRLLQASVDFTPGLPPDTSALWRETPTWMSSHAKFFALYGRPFWLEAGYSGTAQSMVGPMLEIHDATTRSGHAALFGFLGVGAAERLKIGEQRLIEACLAQFGRIFGQDAQAPTATLYKDWATDPLTATPDDRTSTGHPASAPAWVRDPWAARLVLAAGETSPNEAGYLAGAAEASGLVADELVRRLNVRTGRP
jgi:monoamine oxidase